MPGIIPKLLNYGGSVRTSAPSLGQDNDLVYGDYLGLSGDEIEELRVGGVI
jgi:formyl-CoA transferase